MTISKLIIPACSLVFAAVGCAQSVPVSLEFRIAEEEAAPGLTEMTVEHSGESIFVHDTVLLDESHVKDAAVTNPGGHATVIEVEFTPEGARKFEEVTEANVGKMCAMIVNGRLVSAPIIRDTIRGGRAIISGRFTEAEAHEIADGLSGR